MAQLDDVFTNNDQQLIIEALHSLKARKTEALAEVSKHESYQALTAKDFGIPQIEALISRFEDEFEDEPEATVTP